MWIPEGSSFFQPHRRPWAGKEPCMSPCPPPVYTDFSDQAAQDHVQVTFEYLHGWRLHSRTYPGMKIKNGKTSLPLVSVRRQVAIPLLTCLCLHPDHTHFHDLWATAPLQVTIWLLNNNSIQLQLCFSPSQFWPLSPAEINNAPRLLLSHIPKHPLTLD